MSDIDELFAPAANFEEKKLASVKPEYPIYKANPLLVVRDGLTLMQARFFTAYLCKVDPDNPGTYKARFSLAAFCKMLEVDTSNIKRLKEDCSTLRKMGFDFIEYRRRHGEKIDPLLMDEVSLFERFAIVGNYDDGYFVEVTPTRPMEHLLMNQRKYGFVRYEARNTLALSTKRHMRLYEMLKRHEGRGVQIDIPTLKTYLGMDAEEYTEMRDFRQKVLDKGIEEINQKTDITVKITPKRKGRGGKIVGFIFSVTSKKPKEEQPTEEKPPVTPEEPSAPIVLTVEDIAEFNADDEEHSATSPVPQGDELPGQMHLDSEGIHATQLEEEVMRYLPTDVYNNNLNNVRAIVSVLRPHIILNFMDYYEPAENPEDGVIAYRRANEEMAADMESRMCDAIEKFNIVEWGPKKHLAKTSVFGFYKVLLEKWLRENKI